MSVFIICFEVAGFMGKRLTFCLNLASICVAVLLLFFIGEANVFATDGYTKSVEPVDCKNQERYSLNSLHVNDKSSSNHSRVYEI